MPDLLIMAGKGVALMDTYSLNMVLARGLTHVCETRHKRGNHRSEVQQFTSIPGTEAPADVTNNTQPR